MKKLLFCLILTLTQINLFAQNDTDVVIGKIDSIYSNILNEQRKILIHIPSAGEEEIKSETKYPVVYLLDGDSHFTSVVGMIEQLSSNGNTILPKMIIVGIPNTNRTRDLTPSKSEISPPFINKSTSENSGGGKNFLAFLEKELIPKIESKYPTEPYRVFIGHSFGGLTVINTLLNKPNLFNAYIAIDPSMFYNNQKLLKEIKQNGFRFEKNKKTLYLGIASEMEVGFDTLTVKQDKSKNTLPIRSNLEFKDFLDTAQISQLKYRAKYYQNDTHGSVPLITEYDGLRFIFDFYQLKMGVEEYINPESDLFNKIISHFKYISDEFGYEKKPDEKFIDIISSEFLDMKQFKKAKNFLKLNESNYPESYNVYNSLGDFYMATGDKTKAIENYKKSIHINKNSPSVEKLKKIESE